MEQTALARTRQLELEVGQRTVSLVGWSYDVAYRHLATRHADSWCDPKCMARDIYHHGIGSNQDRVRRHFGRLFNYTLDRHRQLIARELDHRWPHRTSRFRLYSGANTGPEAEALELQLRQMGKRKELACRRAFR